MDFKHSFSEKFLIYDKKSLEGPKAAEAQAAAPDPAVEAARVAVEKRDKGKEAVTTKTSAEIVAEAAKQAEALLESETQNLITNLDDINFNTLLTGIKKFGPKLSRENVDKLVQFSMGTFNDNEDNLRQILDAVNDDHIITSKLSIPSIRVLLSESDEDDHLKKFITKLASASSTANKLILATDDEDILKQVFDTMKAKPNELVLLKTEALTVLINEMDLKTVLKANLSPEQKIGLLSKGNLDSGDKFTVFNDLFTDIHDLSTLSTSALDIVIPYAINEGSGKAISILQARLSANADATINIGRNTLIALLNKLHSMNAHQAKEAIKGKLDIKRRQDLFRDDNMESDTKTWLSEGLRSAPQANPAPAKGQAESPPAKPDAAPKAAPEAPAPAPGATPPEGAPAAEAPATEGAPAAAPGAAPAAEAPAPTLDELTGKTTKERLTESGIEVKGNRVVFTVEGAERAERSFVLGKKGNKLRQAIDGAKSKEEVRLIVYKRLL
ncbi:MAG: hypothetical protein O3B47_03305, partial [bacterium]|nr:hypothetical protein [bacterium]